MTVAKARRTWQPIAVPACQGCQQQDRCFLARPLPEETGACADVVRRRFPVDGGERLYRRDAPFSSLYLVCSGSIKTQRETPEGRLVVSGFFLSGDIVGIDAIGNKTFPSDAVATAASEVCQLDFTRLLSECAGRPGLHAWVISHLGLFMSRKENDLSWSTGLQTHQRVLRFFLDLRQRLTYQPDARPLALPMRKQDIAHYLHITPETLSRNLAQLRRDGLLYLDHGRFVLPDISRAQHLTRL